MQIYRKSSPGNFYMYQLLYLSTAVNLMANDELDSLLSEAKTNNHEINITGMLVYHDGCFIQTLEGEKNRGFNSQVQRVG